MKKALIYILFVSNICFAQTGNDTINKLDEVIVKGYLQRKSVALKKATIKHKLVAGGTSIAVMKPEVQRLETLKDALKLEPGVMIQEFFGANDQPRLNIRGSGIQSNPQRRGVYLMQDGIPVNFADGSYVIGGMNPMIAEFVEVFKGSNAMQYGTATLGGVIDFISRVGTKKGKIFLKTQTGSFGYYSATAIAGKKWGKSDAFVTITGSKQNGFRQHNTNKNLNILANYGYDFNENLKNRLYFNYSYINFDVPGPLTYKMIEEDSKQILDGVRLPLYMGANVKRDKPKREVEMFRVADKLSLKLSDKSKVSFSGYYQYANDRFVFPIALSTQHSFYNDLGVKALWDYNTKKHFLKIGLISSFGKIDRNGYINKNGLDSYAFSKDDLTALNSSIFIEEKYNINDRTILIGGIQGAYHLRDSKDIFPNPELRPWYSHSSHKYRYFYSENTTNTQDFFAINPRLGIIYNAGEFKDFQFFANTSCSYEPPTFDELIGTKVTSNTNTSPKELFAVKLKKQQAFTTEIGTRYAGTRYGWNLSVYKSWLKDEVLEVKDFVLGVKMTKNYPQTIHNGVEFGFSIVPIQHIFSNSDKIKLEGVYNYSDFYFSSGKYKGKQLAGIPKHYLVGALAYQYPRTLNAEINIEYQPKDTPIDHENTLMQPAFYLLGFKVSCQVFKKFNIFIEGKNILDKRYASSYIINDQIHSPPIPFPDFTSKNMAFYIPGTPKAYYFGITYKN